MQQYFFPKGCLRASHDRFLCCDVAIFLEVFKYYATSHVISEGEDCYRRLPLQILYILIPFISIEKTETAKGITQM